MRAITIVARVELCGWVEVGRDEPIAVGVINNRYTGIVGVECVWMVRDRTRGTIVGGPSIDRVVSTLVIIETYSSTTSCHQTCSYSGRTDTIDLN